MKALFSIACLLICSPAFTQIFGAETSAHSSSNRHTGIYLLIISLLVLGINWLVTKLTVKKGTKSDKDQYPGLWNFRKYSGIFLLLTVLVSQIYEYWYHPLILIVLILVVLATLAYFVVVQYIRPSDRMYRSFNFLAALVFYVLLVGLCLLSLLTKPEIASSGLSIFIALGTFVLSGFWIIGYLVMHRKWLKLKRDTPVPEETGNTITKSCSLVSSLHREESPSDDGRILLFADRLIFAGKDGTITPIPFNSIEKVSIHKELRIVPAGLELTGFDGQTRYLLVQLPYFWKHKMEAKV
jgi:hypothetical protein